MNIDNSPLDKKCVQALKQQKQFEIIDIDLTKQFHELIKHLKLKDKLSIANLKARLRMLTLYALAQQHDLLVAGTSNADEMYMGYFTKYGDGAADILPLVNLLKNDVYEAAKILKVPQIIINRAPSAGLYDGQTDEKEMGVTYDQIDKFLLKGKTKTPKIRNIIISSHTRNVHKLQLPARPKAYRKIA
jgi:NAD+ synthase